MATDYRGLQYGQQYFPDEEVVDETVTSKYPGGNPVYPRGTRFDPAQGNIPYAPEEKRGFNFNLSKITGPITGGLQWLGDKFKRPDAKQAAYDAITGGQALGTGQWTRGMYGGNEYDLYKSPSGLKVGSEIIGRGPGFEKNFDSMFGSKSLEEMEQKKLDWAMNRVNRGKAISTRLRDILTARGMLGDTRGVTTDAPEFITRGDPRGPVTTGGGGTFDPVLDQRGRRVPGSREGPSWRGATEAREQVSRDTGGARGQVAGPGFGRGSYWAEGGRVGYQGGELVEDESMMEAAPGGMMEENIEEVQGEPSREQLEAIAFEIFQLPLEQLNEQQLEVVYQAAMEQEPSEEEVQFAAQEGPGEGIASLV